MRAKSKPVCVCITSLGMEVLEVMPDPDVVVVCCGGGGLLAGVAAAIKLSGCDKTRIYGVEPDGGKRLTCRRLSFHMKSRSSVNMFRLCFKRSLHHAQKFH